MAKKVYIVELDARNEAALRKIQEVEGATIKASNRMEKSVNRIGAALIAAFSAQQVLSFMKSSIDAFAKQEAAVKKLDVALGRSTSALQKFAAEMQKATTYGDELTIEAMSLVAAFTKDEEQIKKVTKAAMDLAAAKGIDLLSAADLLTRSIFTNTNALKRQGIEINGTAGSTQRLESAINRITQLYGGQATEAANTYTGKLQVLKNELDDVQEDIGSGLLPIWLELNKALATGIGFLQQMSGLTFFKQLAEQDRMGKENIKNRTDQMFGILGVGNNSVMGNFVKQEEKVTENVTTQTEELQKQYDIMEDIYQRMREMDDEDTILGDYKSGTGRGRSKYGPASQSNRASEALKQSLEKAQEPMSALVSLSNQMASNFSFAGHTFVGQLSQAIAMVDSISNMILTIASLFGGGGGFGIGGLLSLIGLEKGGRVTNLYGGISHTKIPSFAMGGSYSTPAFDGAYPVLVHKNETLDVYNSGQTSKMENKLDQIRNAILTTNVHVSKKGKGGGSVIKVNIGRKEIASIVQEELNNFAKSGYNLNEF